MEDGQAFLEDEAIIDSAEWIDADVLAGALIQIALIDGMVPKVSYMVQSVAMLLVQLQLGTTNNTMLKRMEMKLDSMADEAAKRVSAAVGPQLSQMDTLSVAVMGMQEKLAEVVDTLTGMSGDASKLTEAVWHVRGSPALHVSHHLQ